MNVTGHEMLRSALRVTGLILAGWLLAAVFGASTAIRPLRLFVEPLADLTRSVALAVAIVYGVRADP